MNKGENYCMYKTAICQSTNLRLELIAISNNIHVFKSILYMEIPDVLTNQDVCPYVEIPDVINISPYLGMPNYGHIVVINPL